MEPEIDPAGRRRPTLLVVDDDASILRLLVTIFGERYEVRAVTCGEEVLDAFRSGACVDGVVMDVMMPGMDGFAVARALRADERTRGIPIIMLTALDDPAHRDLALAAGATAYVTKPFDPEMLEATVELHLSGDPALSTTS